MKTKTTANLYLPLFAWILIIIPFGTEAQIDFSTHVYEDQANVSAGRKNTNPPDNNILEINSPDDGSVQLRWQVTCNKNITHFEIERSLDGKTFFHIGQVEGAGVSVGNNRFHYTDRSFRQVKASVMYYRLWMLDGLGNDSYSRVVPVIIGKERSAQQPFLLTATPGILASR